MSHVARFAAYAAAFEKAVESDDWSQLEPFFTEDAVYVVGLDSLRATPCEGRAAILAYFKEVLDGFDRRFDTRELELLEGPREAGGSVWIRGAALYRAAGVPEFRLELEETVHFDGDRIARLEDAYTPAMQEAALAYLDAHAAALGIRIGPGA